MPDVTGKLTMVERALAEIDTTAVDGQLSG
jgi:hypothetical protein